MATTTSNDEIEFDFSQLDESLINDQQKQNLIDYINQIQTQKRALNDELNSFKLSTEQRFHQLAQEYDQVHQQVIKHRELESQLRQENDDLKKSSTTIEEQFKIVQQNEERARDQSQNNFEQIRQLTNERDQIKIQLDEKEKENYELKKQRESLEEENNRVHQTNVATIEKLQDLENTTVKLQSLETLWNKERQLYTEQLQKLEQSLVESKKLSIDQQIQITQLKVQLESAESQLNAQNRSLDVSVEEKNEKILTLDRQLREKSQRIEQLQIELQRSVRQMENQQMINEKNHQSMKGQVEVLTKKNIVLNEKCEEQNHDLIKTSSERDVLRNEMKSITELFEKQMGDHEQTIRRLQDELDNTTQLLESIRSKGADLTQLTNFLDGTLNHIRSGDVSTSNSSISIVSCSECRQLKSALVLEMAGKERFRFGYEQLSAMVKEAAPILRRQKQDYEASFEVIAKLTTELNEARKELAELQQLSGESIENYRFIQRENQILIDDNKSLAKKIQVLLAEIEEFRTGKRPVDRDFSSESDPNQQVPLTFRNVVELQNVNQKLDKMLRELRGQNNDADEDLNRNRFDELKKDQQEKQEKLRQAKTEIDSLENQLNSLTQERDFLRVLVSRSSSVQPTNSSVSSSSIDVHQIENLREQLERFQQKNAELTKKNEEILKEKEEIFRATNEKLRAAQYELLTARTENEQNAEKLKIVEEEKSANRMTISSLRTEINSWQERHGALVQIRNKQEEEFFKILIELRQLKEEKNGIECRLNTVENEKKLDSIKLEQIEKENSLLKNEFVKSEKIQSTIEKLQNLADFTKEKSKALFQGKINDLTIENEQIRQRFDQIERERELNERTFQTKIDEIQQNLQQEKSIHLETKNKFNEEKNKNEQIQKKLNELENKIQSTAQKNDFEQQMGDYEKELKVLRVKLDAAHRELEVKQSLIQSAVDNATQLTNNERRVLENLSQIQKDFAEKSSQHEIEIEQLKKELTDRQTLIDQHLETIRTLTEQITTNEDRSRTEFNQLHERYENLLVEKSELEEKTRQTEQFREKILQLETNCEQQKTTIQQNEDLQQQLKNQIFNLESEQQKIFNELEILRSSIVNKDQMIENQIEAAQRAEQIYQELQLKHKEQHETMLKLSTHLAARESEILGSTTDETSVNEPWNAILTMNNYLRVENNRLTEDFERIRLENAQIKERNFNLEEISRLDQQSISDKNLKLSQLQQVQDRFDHDQQQIGQLEERCRTVQREKDETNQENQRLKIDFNHLQQEKENLILRLKTSDENRTAKEKELTEKSAQLVQITEEFETNKARVAALEAENENQKKTNRNLRNIAIKYKGMATGNSGQSPVASTPEADELVPGSLNEVAGAAPSTEAETRRNLGITAEFTEKMNRLRDALVRARTIVTTQQTNLTQLNSELARTKEARIPADQTESHSIIESIRKNYENEINDFRNILQLFESSDNNEQIKEILRLRKRIDDLLANKPTTTTSTSAVSKSSEDVASKRVQPFTTATNLETVISRVVPIAPATGRQIGVATPMTASSTSTTGTTSFGMVPNTETASSQTSMSVEHSHTITTAGTTTTNSLTLIPSATTSVASSGPQLMTPAGINLLQKRPRPDDNDQKSSESTLKRNKPETETTPLIAHVEPQVREQQPSNIQEQTELHESNSTGPTRSEILTTSNESENNPTPMGENLSVDQDNDNRQTSSTSVQGPPTTTIIPIETTAVIEPANDPRRYDIAPIVYDVRNIPTITGGTSNLPNRGSNIRSRPFPNNPRRAWMGRGAGGGRGGFGGRGAGGLGGIGP